MQRYDGPANGSATAAALGVSPDGSTVFVTGTSYTATRRNDYATVAYDATTGTRLWVKRYDGPANGSDSAANLGVSPDGSAVFVTGSSQGATSFLDFATVAYGATTGTRLWVKRYDGPVTGSEDASGALGVSPDGSTVFVAGLSTGATSAYDYATVAYDAATGTRLWVRRYNSLANGRDIPGALGVSPDGSTVFVTGQSYESISSSHYATIAYSATTGTRLWVRGYSGPVDGYDHAGALGVSPDGSAVFVTGSSTGATSYYDYATVAYSIT